MSIGHRRKTDKVIVRTAKQDLQSEYAWLVAQVTNAFHVWNKYYDFTGGSRNSSRLLEHLKTQLKLAYTHKKQILEKREEEKSTNA